MWWSKKPVGRKVKLPPAEESIGLLEWQATPRRVAWTAKLLNDPMGRQWLAMLRNEMPLVYPDGVLTPSSQVALNILPGYQRCLQVITDSAVYTSPRAGEEPPMEYPNPEEE